jgi:hypothetical protein
MGALLLALSTRKPGRSRSGEQRVTALMKAESLPKLDFSKASRRRDHLRRRPTLLFNETQVRELFDELEARYLSNQDPNIHFGLLTDLPDTKARPLDERSNPLGDGRAVRQRFECKVRPRRREVLSSSCIAIASSTPVRVCGWDGSASAASCSISTSSY